MIDGNSVLHRAYYALPDWRNRSGEATAGVYGFMSMLVKSIEDLQPTHLAVVFDHPSPTFRHHLYVGYQTNREKDRQVSEDIWGQVDKLKEILEKMQVAVYQTEGFEADDVIGTITTRWAKKGTQVVIVTGDRDLMQLVDSHTRLYMPQKGVTDAVLVDRGQVKIRLGIWPEQVIDYKALVGDSSDNYPGVTGVGPKTAAQLLADYKSLDGIYKHIQDAKFKAKESLTRKLIAGFEAAELSKKLAAIRTDVPVAFDKGLAKLPPQDQLVRVFVDLGYKSLVKRLSAEAASEMNDQPSLFK